MTQYEDETIRLDDVGVTIKSYHRPQAAKDIPYSSILDFEVFEMGFWSGRHRLVGISPGRPRSWFHWDRSRNTKRKAISLDVGTWIRPTFAPEEPETVEEVLRKAVAEHQPR